MSVQLTYTKNTRNALVGLVSDLGPYRIESYTNETGIVPFGLGVQHGTAEGDAVLGSGTAGLGFLGVATRHTAKENSVAGAEEEQYAEKQTMAIIREGSVWVELAAGGVRSNLIYMIEATGVFNVGTPGAGEFHVGTLETDTAAGELGLLRLNTPS